MSTKKTLAINDDFHFYQEAFDDENVCLEVQTPYLDQMVLKIPLEFWNEMRKHAFERSKADRDS
jgi:hypothetical protein